VIIFTEYRATQKWLYNLLARHGFAEEERLELIYGGMRTDERERIKAAFQASPTDAAVRILLATDAASEGVNLQNHCSKLIHFEIPWNPNRMEQRNGRVDRHGQKAEEVEIFHFVGKGFGSAQMVGKVGDLEADLEFLMRAALKVETIREDLGKVGPVIAAQVEEAMLGKRSKLDTARAEHEAEPVRRMLKFERKLRDQLEKLASQLDETISTLARRLGCKQACMATGTMDSPSIYRRGVLGAQRIRSSVLVAAINAKKREDAKALVRLRMGDLVPTGKRTLFLTNLASRLFENRVSRKLILEAVTEQCREFCEDGVSWAVTLAGKKKLRAIANDATLRLKRVNPVYLRRESHGSKLTEGPDARRVRETAARVASIIRFPDSISATEVYRRLGLDKNSRAAQCQVSRDLKSAGFAAKRVNRQWVWERIRQVADAQVTDEMVASSCEPQ
jgi:hypothetical protein